MRINIRFLSQTDLKSYLDCELRNKLKLLIEFFIILERWATFDEVADDVLWLCPIEMRLI